MKLHDIYKLKKSSTHCVVCIECFLLCIILILGLFASEMPRDIMRASLTADSQVEYAILQPQSDGIQADAREIRGRHVRISCIAASGRIVREENLRILAIFFLLLTGFVLLTLRQVSVKCYHSHSHGKVSIVRYIHLQDGQK